MRVTAASIVNLIRENLNDRYRNGFPIIQELVQNADDAGATRLEMGWLQGIEDAQHPLLRGPALFVVNNGRFTPADAEAIDCIALSSKAGDQATIGKFGLGLKSIFHLCEAFFYIYVRRDNATAPPLPKVRSSTPGPTAQQFQM